MNIERFRLELNCDNDRCDFTIADIPDADAEGWVDRPCPKCGENLLTREDFDRWSTVQKAAELINTLTPEQLKLLGEATGVKPTQNGGEMVTMVVGTHKRLSIEFPDEP